MKITKNSKNLKNFFSITLTLILAIVLSLSVLTACGGENGNSASSGSGDGSNNNGGAFEFGEDYISNNLKGDYQIIYNVTAYQDGETENITMEQIRTAEGYYWATGDDGVLFIKNGENYDLYVKNGDKYENSGILYPKDTAEIMMSSVSMYMTTYAAYGDSLNKTGSQTIAGRDCNEYTLDYTYPGFGYKYKYTYCIDKETGVCLKVQMAIEGAGEKIGYEFECTKFQTSGVSLPAYS
jgi:hypothetical protein